MGLLLLNDVGGIYALPTLTMQWMPLGLLLAMFVFKNTNYSNGGRFGGRYFFIAITQFICCWKLWLISYKKRLN